MTNDKFRKWITEDQVNRRAVDAYFARMLFMFFAGDIKANPDDYAIYERTNHKHAALFEELGKR